jgi:hypothetical protein
MMSVGAFNARHPLVPNIGQSSKGGSHASRIDGAVRGDVVDLAARCRCPEAPDQLGRINRRVASRICAILETLPNIFLKGLMARRADLLVRAKPVLMNVVLIAAPP